MASNLPFTLTQIEYALAVHRHGHFAKAAEDCNVTQPTLSMQIHKLEELLGIILFDRTRKPILLTDAGAPIIAQFQSILQEAKKIESLTDEITAKAQSGLLKLGVIPTMAPYIIPKLLPMLEREAPALDLTISELQTHQILSSLEHDEIDVGLLATPLRIPHLTEHPLFFEPFSILCRKGHAIANAKRARYADLKLNDIWLLTEGHCLRNQVLDVCSIKKNRSQYRKFNFESGSLETLKALVESYGGYTLLPQMATSTIGKHSTLIEFERPIPAREVGLVYARRQHKIALIERLAEVILMILPESLRKLRPKDLDVLPVE